MPQRTIRLLEETKTQIETAAERGGFSSPTALFAMQSSSSLPLVRRRAMARKSGLGRTSSSSAANLPECTAGSKCSLRISIP
jgi:hypothetical protein